MKISLIGFMGTGKSSIGKLLAEKLDLDFLDTDDYIEEREGTAIPEIFASRGEEYFRRLEKRVLREILDRKDDFVLATGGGIVLSRENRELLKSRTFPVLLTASPEEIYRRTKGGDRPLLAEPDPERRIEELLKIRAPYYNLFTDRIDTGGKDLYEIVKEIIEMIEDK